MNYMLLCMPSSPSLTCLFLIFFFTLHVNFFQEENVKLSEELQRAVDNSANLCEKVIKLDLKCDHLKNRLEDIKKDTG